MRGQWFSACDNRSCESLVWAWVTNFINQVGGFNVNHGFMETINENNVFEDMDYWDRHARWEAWLPFNSLWPSDATWRLRSGSTSVQVVAWYQPAPSCYLKQYWLLISQVFKHSYHDNFTTSTQAIILLNQFWIADTSPWDQWVNTRQRFHNRIWKLEWMADVLILLGKHRPLHKLDQI